MRPGAMLQILRRAAGTEAPLPRQAGVEVAPGRLAAPPCSYHLLPARSAHITARYVCITVVRTATQILAELRASEAADWRTAANKFLPQVGAMDVPPAVAPQLGQGHSLTLACPRMLQSAGVSRRTPCLPPPAGLVWQWGGDADRPSGHRLQVGRPPGVNATALLLRLPFQVAPDTALLLRLPLRVPSRPLQKTGMPPSRLCTARWWTRAPARTHTRAPSMGRWCRQLQVWSLCPSPHDLWPVLLLT